MIKLGEFSTYNGSNGVSIANSQPNGCDFPVYTPLQPGWGLVNAWKRHEITDDEYEAMYRMNILSKLDKGTVINDLYNLVKDVPVLLCWCKKGTFCHRYIVAKWLMEE